MPWHLASTLALPNMKAQVLVCQRWVVPPLIDDLVENKHMNLVSLCETKKKDWWQPLIDYLDHRKLPNDPHHKREIRHRVPQFINFQRTLY